MGYIRDLDNSQSYVMFIEKGVLDALVNLLGRKNWTQKVQRGC